MADLVNLAKDPFFHLSQFLGEREVVRLSGTCKALRQKINADKRIWTHLARRHFGIEGTIDRNWYRLARDPLSLSLAKVKEVKKIRDVTKKLDGEVKEVCGAGPYVAVLSISTDSYPELCCFCLEDHCWYGLTEWNDAKGLTGGMVNEKAAFAFTADRKRVTLAASIPVEPDGLFTENSTPRSLPHVEHQEGHQLLGQGVIFMDHQYGTAQLWRSNEGNLTLTRAILTLDSDSKVS